VENKPLFLASKNTPLLSSLHLQARKTKPATRAGLCVFIAVNAYFRAKIQFTNWRALPSVMATELGGIDKPLTLPFQWLL
jgi:hypothetical protein